MNVEDTATQFKVNGACFNAKLKAVAADASCREPGARDVLYALATCNHGKEEHHVLFLKNGSQTFSLSGKPIISVPTAMDSTAVASTETSSTVSSVTTSASQSVERNGALGPQLERRNIFAGLFFYLISCSF